MVLNLMLTDAAKSLFDGVYMKFLLPILLVMSAFAQANDVCDKVLKRAANEKKPEAALSVLGACLAGPAPSKIHQQVALEMANISLRTGDTEAALRYLDILRIMLEDMDTNH